jgi:hypothetical protein
MAGVTDQVKSNRMAIPRVLRYRWSPAGDRQPVTTVSIGRVARRFLEQREK